MNGGKRQNAPSQKRSLEFTGTTLQCSPDSRERSLTIDRQVIEESTSRGGAGFGESQTGGPANALPLLVLWLRISPGQKGLSSDRLTGALDRDSPKSKLLHASRGRYVAAKDVGVSSSGAGDHCAI